MFIKMRLSILVSMALFLVAKCSVIINSDNDDINSDRLANDLIGRFKNRPVEFSTYSGGNSVVRSLRIAIDEPTRKVLMTLDNNSNTFYFPLTKNRNRTFDYGELEENLVEVCFKLINSTNLARATKLKRLSEFCNENFYDHLFRLDLSSNKITSYPTELLDRWFIRLEDLNLSNNSIEHLGLSGMNNLATSQLSRSSLKRLDLSLNRLERLEQETFKRLSAIRSLNLSKNQIKSVNLFAFASDSHSLVELDLSHNLVTDQSIEFLLFASFVNLRSLMLDYNRLTALSNHLFYNLYNLEYLSLSHNNIKAFDLINFNSNELLRVLDLSYNLNLRLVDKQNDEQNEKSVASNSSSLSSSSLEMLNLAGVDLGHVSGLFLESVFERFSRLKLLNLTSTRLKSLVSAQRWPPSLQVVDLSSNFLREAQFDCNQFSRLDALKRVYLKHNRFKSFEAFVDSCSLLLNRSVRFDLRFNLFESLDGLIATNMSICRSVHSSRMAIFHLDGNPLVCDCDDNIWWSKIETTQTTSTNKFQISTKQHSRSCVLIDDYASLKCQSISDSKLSTSFKSWPANSSHLSTFTRIERDRIAPALICPYSYACSSQTCECCGFRACDCAFYCPSQCHCARDYAGTFDRVNCSASSLSLIPSYFPMTSTEIVLSSNSLKRIQPYQFFGRLRLERIDLSRNSLAFIEENSFNGLSHLKTLLMSYNELQILLGYEFKDLIGLEYLDLEQNKIQFISNATFTTLVRLQYLNLLGNPLRHVMETRVYFEFNLNLINLSVDRSVAEIAAPTVSTQQAVSNAVTKRRKLTTSATVLSGDNSVINNSFKTSESIALSPVQYTEHIRNLLINAKYSSELVECILSKYKQTIDNELKNNRTLRAAVMTTNLSSRSPEFMRHWLKELLTHRLRQFKASCKSLHESQSDTIHAKSLAQTYDNNNNNNDYDLLKQSPQEESDETVLISEVTRKSAASKSSKSLPDEPLIVLNYNTIGICILVLIGLIGLFSVVFAYLLNRLQCGCGGGGSSGSSSASFSSNKPPKSLSSSSSLSRRTSINITAGEINPTVNRRSWMRRLFKSIKNRLLNVIRPNKSGNKLNHSPSSIAGYKRGRGRNRRMISTSLTSTSSHSLAYGVSMQTLPVYDLLLVYNKIDADFVHKIIAPILRSKPYNFRLVLEHDEANNNVENDDYHDEEESRSNVETKIDSLLALSKQCSFVLFVLSKHLFTGIEYDLAAQTPKQKRLAMLADDVSESVAEKVIQPCRILKATFNLNSMTFNFKSVPTSNSACCHMDSESTSSTVASSSLANEEANPSFSAGASTSDEVFFESSTISEANGSINSRIFRKKLQLFNKFEF